MKRQFVGTCYNNWGRNKFIFQCPIPYFPENGSFPRNYKSQGQGVIMTNGRTGLTKNYLFLES